MVQVRGPCQGEQRGCRKLPWKDVHPALRSKCQKGDFSDAVWSASDSYWSLRGRWHTVAHDPDPAVVRLEMHQAALGQPFA